MVSAVVFVAAVACISAAAANPHYRPRPACAAPLPAIKPSVVQSVLPAPVNIGPQGAGVIEHASAPYEINYFGKPWVVKHKQSAGLNVYTQTPVVVDEYAAPSFSEQAAPPAVLVEQVQAAPTAYAAPAYSAYPSYAGAYSGAYAAPCAAPAYAPAPCW